MQIVDLEKFLAGYTDRHYGELDQDVLALAVSDRKSQGFFVEFGVMDGIKASNTYLLETAYGWQGIVCEPGRTFHDSLRQNRRCKIDLRAVTGRSGEQLRFKETDIQLGLSGLVDYFDPAEKHSRRRNSSQGNMYTVPTVSLTDLLDQHDAPEQIDYISMDTEGSELAILETFDFTQYRVDLWTIEHNHVDARRESIQAIMHQQGYVNILPHLSKYDDWYLRKDLLS